jgi:signal transduction histidine kinase
MKESFMQTLLKSKVEIQEHTLDHISKELHSNISQIASLININLSTFIEKNFTNDTLLETKSLAKQLLSELKSISASLNTDYIMKIGFSRALENEVLKVSKPMKKNAILSRSGEEFRISPEREIILFRLCQEVLNNTIRYAKASQLKVNLNFKENIIELEIIDDGIGFDVNIVEQESSKKESTGLINIKKRAEIINASLTVESQIDLGTRVFIKIPKENQLQNES